MTTTLNGINVDDLVSFTELVAKDPEKGITDFGVTSRWRGQTRMEAEVSSYTMGGVKIPKSFTIATDEPKALLGGDTGPNPQELLMAAVNACMMVGYVATAAARGITLSKLEIETRGRLDLRGFLGISDDVIPGYASLDYVVTIGGDATEDQFADLHQHVLKTSPNYFNMTHAVPMNGKLVVEGDACRTGGPCSQERNGVNS